MELDVGFCILFYCIDHVKTISDVSHTVHTYIQSYSMSGLSVYSKTSMAVSLHWYFQCLPNRTYRVHTLSVITWRPSTAKKSMLGSAHALQNAVCCVIKVVLANSYSFYFFKSLECNVVYTITLMIVPFIVWTRLSAILLSPSRAVLKQVPDCLYLLRPLVMLLRVIKMFRLVKSGWLFYFSVWYKEDFNWFE